MTPTQDRLSTALDGRYTIVREIGAGGMATVFLAEDVRHRRKVAIKVLHPELTAVLGPERFLNEIELTANLQHPHILPLFDSGAADTLLFYVMPFVEGETLRQKLRREQQLPIAEAVRIATDVADALEYAHKHGVVHRDIKPENVLLHEGRPLVADFGIALAVQQAGGERMTQTGMSLGTPQYMAPEQAMGDKGVDFRADIYALGAVTYEMLTGEPPFTGPNAQAIVAKILTTDPSSLIGKRRSVPAHVEDAVLTALEKMPADRFGSAAEFAASLRAQNASLPTTRARRASAAPSSDRAVPWRLIALGVGVVAALASGLGFAAARMMAGDDTPPVVTRFVVTTPEDHRLAGSGFTVVALSPDGSTLVYAGQSTRGVQLYRRKLDELEATPIAGTEGAIAVLFSPDGRWLAYPTGAGLRKVPVGGGAAVNIATNSLGPQAGVWLDNESMVLTALGGGIHALDGDGKSRLIAAPDTSKGEASLIVTDALEGGSAVLVVAASGGAVAGRPYIVDVESGERRLVLDQAVNTIGYDNGHVVWADQEGNLSAAKFDPDKGMAGPPVTLAQRVRVSVGGASQFALSRNGSLVYVPQRPLALMIVDRQGVAVAAADIQRQFHSPRVSPDGAHIAVDFTQQGSRDVWSLDVRERTLTRLTFDNDGHDPVWDPTGRRVAYATSRNGVIGMFLRNADGSGGADSLYVGTSSQTVGAFFPEGQRALSIVTGVAGSFDLAVTPLSGDRKEQILLGTDFNEYYPAVSPDGKWLAYVSDESGQNEVYVRPLTGGGGKTLVSLSGGTEPVWSRRGDELFYRGYGVQGTPLVAVSAQTSPAFRVTARRELFDVSDYEPATPHANYDVGPDGKFVMVHQGRLSEMVVIQNWIEEVRRRSANPR